MMSGSTLPYLALDGPLGNNYYAVVWPSHAVAAVGRGPDDDN